MLTVAVAFLVVIPEGILRCHFRRGLNESFNRVCPASNISFATFCPKIACQAPKPSKSLKGKDIEW
jgi:hypothetical protein